MTFVRRMLFFFVFLCVGFFALAGGAQPSSEAATPPPSTFEELFKNGVQSYQSGKYDEARELLSQALDKDPNSVSALTNLALTQFQLGKKGYAVALLRKSLALNPDFPTSKAALQFILPQLEVKEIPHEIQFWESFRSQLLEPVPMWVYLFLTALFLFAAGWLWLGFFGRRRKALKDNELLPPFPTVAFVLALGFVICFSLNVLKIYDFQTPRGTVIADKISVLSAPDEKSVTLFDLYAGLEVVLLSVNNEWVQVTYPGALSGWVPKATVLHTSGKVPW
jgi:tetratricopeptide (TPR) repeat protein